MEESQIPCISLVERRTCERENSPGGVSPQLKGHWVRAGLGEWARRSIRLPLPQQSLLPVLPQHTSDSTRITSTSTALPVTPPTRFLLPSRKFFMRVQWKISKSEQWQISSNSKSNRYLLSDEGPSALFYFWEGYLPAQDSGRSWR